MFAAATWVLFACDWWPKWLRVNVSVAAICITIFQAGRLCTVKPPVFWKDKDLMMLALDNAYLGIHQRQAWITQNGSCSEQGPVL